MEAGSYNIKAILGYMLWQSDRGKGFIALKVHGPEPLRQMFDELINYQAKVKVRYEVMYWEWCKNQITLVTKNKKLSFEKDVWVTKAI